MSVAAPAGSAVDWRPYEAGRADLAGLGAEVHVWRLDLDGDFPLAGENLPAEDRSRADRFGRREDRHRFVATRSVLRMLLSEILGTGDDPKGDRFRLGQGAAGKPFLADTPGLHFNVSHSGTLALIAVTRAGAVGVDVERQRAIDDVDGVASLMFTAAERAALRDGPAAEREALFYRTWTRKEALLKAMGAGLSAAAGPDTIPPDADDRWQVTTLPGLDGYAGALARPRAARDIRLWCWPGALAL